MGAKLQRMQKEKRIRRSIPAEGNHAAAPRRPPGRDGLLCLSPVNPFQNHKGHSWRKRRHLIGRGFCDMMKK